MMKIAKKYDESSLKGKILFRSITPLPYFKPPEDWSATGIPDGSRNGEEYSVRIVYSSGEKTVWSGILEYWAHYKQLHSNSELIKYMTCIGKCYWFLVIDSIAVENENTRVASNTWALIDVYKAAIKALTLHHGALGPYVEQTWQLRHPPHPYFPDGISKSTSLVSMNSFLCPATQLSLVLSDSFQGTFQSLLNSTWDDSMFGRIINQALEAISGSLRSESSAHSLVLLAIAFESLFTKDENDFSGGCKRLAQLAGHTKGEVTDIKHFLDRQCDGVRALRNNIVHGDTPFADETIKDARKRFAQYLAGAIIFLVKFADKLSTGDYYDKMEMVANDQFKSLPYNT